MDLLVPSYPFCSSSSKPTACTEHSSWQQLTLAAKNWKFTQLTIKQTPRLHCPDELWHSDTVRTRNLKQDVGEHLLNASS